VWRARGDCRFVSVSGGAGGGVVFQRSGRAEVRVVGEDGGGAGEYRSFGGRYSEVVILAGMT
jgi:hypothetical protein